MHSLENNESPNPAQQNVAVERQRRSERMRLVAQMLLEEAEEMDGVGLNGDAGVVGIGGAENELQPGLTFGLAAVAQQVLFATGEQLETSEAQALRAAVIGGDWDAALALLSSLPPNTANQQYNNHNSDHSYNYNLSNYNYYSETNNTTNNMSPAEAIALVQEQRFLETLFGVTSTNNNNNARDALLLLRRPDVAAYLPHPRRAALAARLMNLPPPSPPSSSPKQTTKLQRASLLARIAPAVFPSIPRARLTSLLNDAIAFQASRCLYHNVRDPSDLSLLQDHVCVPALTFPGTCWRVLDDGSGRSGGGDEVVAVGHKDEVWMVTFSPDARRLASASKDCSAIIWDADTFQILHTLRGHVDHVSVVAWSPDSRLILTGSNDHSVKLWDAISGLCISTFSAHGDTITALAFVGGNANNSFTNSSGSTARRFVSSSLDKNVLLWSIETGQVLHKWTGVRVTDFGISHDGSRLITVSDKRIRVFGLSDNINTVLGANGPKDEILSVQETDSITSISVAQDTPNGRYILVNVSGSQEIHLWDLDEQPPRVIRTYAGHKQSRFVIRSSFGGYHDTFVVSGSEDSNVYVWSREHGKLLEILKGHTGTVNSISWNRERNIFASASDDHTIRIWGVAVPPASSASTSTSA
ncbi:hypothetical protein HK100_011267 [Physocladia obscura]|uniref:WD40 repeat-like protein n=1 Tax=Physocladia obscura TaxID=109957 RepID=A0AAD5XIF1_9FUNG|nr:hypothetical protein HK100_011267 [Physocladia obscura]